MPRSFPQSSCKFSILMTSRVLFVILKRTHRFSATPTVVSLLGISETYTVGKSVGGELLLTKRILGMYLYQTDLALSRGRGLSGSHVRPHSDYINGKLYKHSLYRITQSNTDNYSFSSTLNEFRGVTRQLNFGWKLLIYVRTAMR